MGGRRSIHLLRALPCCRVPASSGRPSMRLERQAQDRSPANIITERRHLSSLLLLDLSTMLKQNG